MKRTLLLLAVIVVLVFAAVVVECQTLDDLQSMRWAALSMVNVKVTGTPQITTAFVDSMIVMAEQTVGTDPTFLHMMPTDTQTVIATIETADTLRTQFYTMNTNFLPNGLTGAMRREFSSKQFYRINAFPPPASAALPKDGDVPAKKPTHVWTEGNVLIIQPAPSQKDQFFLTYRALPDKMTEDTSDTDIPPGLRRMVVILAAADIQKRRTLGASEAALRREAAALKSELLVLPAAALSGGNQ